MLIFSHQYIREREREIVRNNTIHEQNKGRNLAIM